MNIINTKYTGALERRIDVIDKPSRRNNIRNNHTANCR